MFSIIMNDIIRMGYSGTRKNAPLVLVVLHQQTYHFLTSISLCHLKLEPKEKLNEFQFYFYMVTRLVIINFGVYVSSSIQRNRRYCR